MQLQRSHLLHLTRRAVGLATLHSKWNTHQQSNYNLFSECTGAGYNIPQWGKFTNEWLLKVLSSLEKHSQFQGQSYSLITKLALVFIIKIFDPCTYTTDNARPQQLPPIMLNYLLQLWSKEQILPIQSILNGIVTLSQSQILNALITFCYMRNVKCLWISMKWILSESSLL